MNPDRQAGSSGRPFAPEVLQLAGLGRRWGALAYEWLLLAALFLVAGFAALPLVGPPAATQSAQDLYVLRAASRDFLFLYYVVVAAVYCVGFWSGGRRTLAMKAWRIALVRADGSEVDLRHAIVRYAAGWIGPAAALGSFATIGRWGLIAGSANFVWAWLDPERQFLHDRIAGTRIVRT